MKIFYSFDSWYLLFCNFIVCFFFSAPSIVCRGSNSSHTLLNNTWSIADWFERSQTTDRDVQMMIVCIQYHIHTDQIEMSGARIHILQSPMWLTYLKLYVCVIFGTYTFVSFQTRYFPKTVLFFLNKLIGTTSDSANTKHVLSKANPQMPEIV